jgi:site-specific DNA-cytosine methylase
MRVLVACERSGVVRSAFRNLGHAAYSADLEAADDDSPYHILGDVLSVLDERWDLLIAHPPCNHLSVSGAKWFAVKRADGRQPRAMEFFMRFANCHHIPRICIENPVGIMSTQYRKPDQIIQPYEYGEDASKKTCLWLKGLPKLQSTQRVAGRMVNGKERWSNQTDSGQNRLGPSEDRAEKRAKTYPGIAKAMAEQWGQA